MENGNRSRLLFVTQGRNGRPTKVQELIDGAWVEVDVMEYFHVSTDLFHRFDSWNLDGYLWTNDNDFSAPALATPGNPPTPAEALAVLGAYLMFLQGDSQEEIVLDGIVFVDDREARQSTQ